MKIQRGEIIRINLNPTSGKQSGARLCLVISQTKYNLARNGIIIVTPITSTIKPKIKMMIPLPNGFKINGSVIAEQVRTLDLKTRWWQTTGEVLPKKFVDRVVDTFKVIISED